jgi:2,3-bisphosphoglycerate-dependent phosphoglycerate mutase
MVRERAPAARLLLVRHGESTTNAANVFTGWSDPPLTEIGRDEAGRVAHRLLAADLRPDRVFSSVLDRSLETARIILDVMGTPELPLVAHPALNERNYGALTGLNKAQAAARYGAEQVRQWRRSYATPPPDGESLRDTAARVLAYYVHVILPATLSGGTTLIVSHGNTLRALAMALDGLDAGAVERFDLSTGATILYELDEASAVIRRTVLN